MRIRFVHQEGSQFLPAQLLYGAAAAYKILAIIRNGILLWIDNNGNILFAILFLQIHTCHKTHVVLDFVRHILKELLGIVYTYDSSIIFYTDIERSALSIGKRTYLAEKLIFPQPFELCMLIFFHPCTILGAKLHKNFDICKFFFSIRPELCILKQKIPR